jgi:TRAP-type mannitol/chloroaromatic compound transport system permease large subunit
MIIALALLILVVVLLIGVPVPFAFLASTTFLIFYYGYDPSFLLPYGFSRMNNVVILAIPLFIIAGGLINQAHIGDKLIDLVELFIGRVKGGLGAVAVIACGVFGAITGSSSATLSAIGTILFPRLQAAGYPGARVTQKVQVIGQVVIGEDMRT